MSPDETASTLHPFYESLQHRLKEQRERLGDPAHLKAALRALTPERFAIANGNVVSSNPKVAPVGPFDAILLDQARNAPLLFGPTGPFPIELVAATLLLLPRLEDHDLRELRHMLANMRRLAKRGRFYTAYVELKKPNGRSLAPRREVRVDLPPRCYVLAQTADGDRSDKLAARLKDALHKDDELPLDGLLVLDRDWFFHQPDHKHRIEHSAQGGMVHFIDKLLADLATPLMPMQLSRYLPKE